MIYLIQYFGTGGIMGSIGNAMGKLYNNRVAQLEQEQIEIKDKLLRFMERNAFWSEEGCFYFREYDKKLKQSTADTLKQIIDSI